MLLLQLILRNFEPHRSFLTLGSVFCFGRRLQTPLTPLSLLLPPPLGSAHRPGPVHVSAPRGAPSSQRQGEYCPGQGSLLADPERGNFGMDGCGTAKSLDAEPAARLHAHPGADRAKELSLKCGATSSCFLHSLTRHHANVSLKV